MDLSAPPRPPGAPAPTGHPGSLPRHTVTSPASQALTAGAWLLVLAAIGLRADQPVESAMAALALVAGIGFGLGLDLRRLFGAVSGVVLALVTFAVLAFVWVWVYTQADVEPPFLVVPLASLVVFGADWWWVERLRPAVVLSGLGLVPVLERELVPGLVVALVWFALLAGALWSLRADAVRALPTPLAIVDAAEPEPPAGRTALGVVAAWLVAAGAMALIATLAFSPDPPDPLDDPDMGRDRFSWGSGGFDTDGDGLPDTGVDGDGDGVLDPDLDGDGRADGDTPFDLDGDGFPDQYADVDGDGIPDWSDEGPGDGDRSWAGEQDGEDGGAGSAGPPDAPSADAAPDDAADAGATDDDPGRTVLLVAGLVLLLVAAAAAAWLVHQRMAERRALAARPWPLVVAERLEHEGGRRGRQRHRDEPVTAYADVLGAGVLGDERLAGVGAAVSAGLFGAHPPSDTTGAWAAQVVDEAVAAHPLPTWRDAVRERVRRSGPAEPLG